MITAFTFFITHFLKAINNNSVSFPLIWSWCSQSAIRRTIVVLAFLFVAFLICMTIPPELNYTATLADYISLIEPILYAIMFIRGNITK